LDLAPSAIHGGHRHQLILSFWKIRTVTSSALCRKAQLRRRKGEGRRQVDRCVIQSLASQPFCAGVPFGETFANIGWCGEARSQIFAYRTGLSPIVMTASDVSSEQARSHNLSPADYLDTGNSLCREICSIHAGRGKLYHIATASHEDRQHIARSCATVDTDPKSSVIACRDPFYVTANGNL